MKRKKLIISIVVLVIMVGGAVFIDLAVYDFVSPSVKWVKDTFGQTGEQQKDSSVADANKPGSQAEPNRPGAGDKGVSDSNKPGKVADVNEPNAPADVNEPNEPNKPAEPNEPTDPNKMMEAVNLKDVQMKDIIAKIAEWTGKQIIPYDEVMNQKITIYSPTEVPRPQALELIYAALKTKGYIAEEVDGVIYLKPLKDALFGSVPTIPLNIPLASVENKSQIAQRYFPLENYSPTSMSNILMPLVGEYGYISADESTGSIMVIDTVANLIRFERVIMQFDSPGSEQYVTEFFRISDGEPAEIVQMLQLLLGVDSRTGRRRIRTQRQGQAQTQRGGESKPPTSVIIGETESLVTLIPEPKRKMIIAKASPDDMEKIAEWIGKLDQKKELETEYETIPIRYVDAYEVGDRINRAMQRIPGTTITSNVLVQPLSQARQIMVFGTKDMREMVKKLIAEIDIPTGVLESKTFSLEYADPERIKENLDELYGEDVPMYDTYTYYRYGPGSRRGASDEVRVIAYPTMMQVTVIASPENLVKIAEQIKGWDIPIDVDALKPRIKELRNTDPRQMVTLLSKLFSEETSDTFNIYDYIFGPGRRGDQQKKIVGALYGQLTFEAVPETKKIIIISKVPEAYKVVEELIDELDSAEMAEVPDVVPLKYANPEDLAIRLNAIFNEQGVAAPIWLSETGLSEFSMDEEEQSQQQRSNQQQQQQQGSSRGQYTPPWSSQRSRADEDRMPLSNVIGRIRFIPDPHSKSLLVLSPPDFRDKVLEMIDKLDQPGRQVMIKVVIMEVDHSNLTSLGLQLSTNPFAFGTIGENAITAITSLAYMETYGTLTLDAASDISTLIDFLVKRVDAKILNQQTLWTKDNEEAQFFKGSTVPFQESASTSETGGRVTSSFSFEDVGMTLQTRPSITPEKNVDMVIKVKLSQLTGEEINSQPVRSQMSTQTNMIVKDAQTIMLGGILFQTDSVTERKVPLFGDLPGIGSLFRHYEEIQRNNELIIFITPYVIDTDTGPEVEQQLKEAEDKLKKMLRELDETMKE